MNIRFFYFLLFSLFLLNLTSCQKQIVKDDEEVWKTVERRTRTWKERDKNDQLEIYHSEFRRWAGETLHNKETFLNNWDLIDTRINDMQIERIELQFFNNDNLNIAHYRITEKLEWIGKDFQEDDFKISTG